MIYWEGVEIGNGANSARLYEKIQELISQGNEIVSVIPTEYGEYGDYSSVTIAIIIYTEKPYGR